MKPIRVAEDIFALGEFKAQTSRILRQLHRTGRPVIITQNGRPTAVMLSPEGFDQLSSRERFLEAIYQGLSDSEEGRVIDDEDLARELEAEFGKAEKE